MLLPAAVLTALAGFLLGSIPTGWLVARARGVDIQKSGSGNIGATNVFRVLGVGPGILVLAVDALKGVLAVRLAPAMAAGLTGAAGSPGLDWLPMLGGLASVLGHNYTPWLGFRGGKGIATSAGVLGGLMPAAFGVTVAAFAVVLGSFRIVSLASVLAAVVLPAAVFGLEKDRRLLGLSLVMSVLAIYKHRANLRRLMAGTEPRIGQKPAPAAGEGSK